MKQQKRANHFYKLKILKRDTRNTFRAGWYNMVNVMLLWEDYAILNGVFPDDATRKELSDSYYEGKTLADILGVQST